MLLVAHATGLNFSFLHFLNLGFVLVTFLLILSVVRDSPLNSTGRILVLSLTSIVNFSLQPVGVYLWGMSIYIYLTILLCVAALKVLSQEDVTWFEGLLVVVLNQLALLTSIDGLAMLVMTILIGGIKFRESRRRVWLAVSTTASVQLALMVLLLSRRKLGIDISLFGHGPIEFARYVCAYLGVGVSMKNVRYAVVGGATLMILFAANLVFSIGKLLKAGVRIIGEADQFFVFIGCFSIGTALLTAIGREGAYGAEQALTDRYIPYAGLLILSVSYGMARLMYCHHWRTAALPLRIEWPNSPRVIRAISALLFAMAWLLAIDRSFNSDNVKEFETYRWVREDARMGLLHAPQFTAAEKFGLEHIYPGGYEPIKSRVEFMKRERLGPFKDMPEKQSALRY